MGKPDRNPAGLVLLAMATAMVVTNGGLTMILAQEDDQPDPPQIEKAAVDEACAVSQVNFVVYEDALSAFQQASAEWDLVLQEIEDTRSRREVATSLVARKAQEVEELRAELEQSAIELYMQQGALSLASFIGNNPGEVIVGSHYLETETEIKLARINDYLSSQQDLDRHREEITAVEARLAELEAQRQDWMRDLAAAAQDQYGAWEELDAQCQDLVRQWEIQEARRRAEEARRRAEEARRREQARLQAIARASRQSQGVGPIAGLVCPFPGSTFVDSWGAPRSGGRTHKGVDMFGSHGAPLYAVAGGTITITNGGRGGRAVWIHSDTGVAYYYAHLSGWAVSQGDRVSKGQVVGYNGASGNAWGGLPHLHLQLHPAGRGTPAYNPYPTMRAAC